VAVAARNDDEIWVVNHLSDSVSVVQMTQGGHSGRIVRTLLVGTIVTLFSDTPRALAVSPDGSKVYAAAFHSGNRRGVKLPRDEIAGEFRSSGLVFFLSCTLSCRGGVQ